MNSPMNMNMNMNMKKKESNVRDQKEGREEE